MARKTERLPLAHYPGLNYPVLLYPEAEGGYTVEIQDLPGCISQGETAAEAMKMIEEARQLWLETAYEQGDPIPLPPTDESFSGRILLRLPRTLHRRLIEEARRDATSLNQYLVALLSEQNVLHEVRHDISVIQEGVADLRMAAGTQSG